MRHKLSHLGSYYQETQIAPARQLITAPGPACHETVE